MHKFPRITGDVEGRELHVEDLQPGEWLPVQRSRPDANGSTRSAIIRCPGCERTASLDDYLIAPSGWVSPSFVCPTVIPLVCPFAVIAVLLHWDAGGTVAR